MICKQQDCFTDFTFPTVLLASLACEFSQSLSAWNKSGSKLQYYALLLLLLLLLFGGEGGRGEWQQDSHSFCLFCFLNSTIPVKRMLIWMKQMVVQSDNTSWKASQEQPSMVNRWMWPLHDYVLWFAPAPSVSTVKFCADSTKVLWWDQINWGHLLLLLFIAFI